MESIQLWLSMYLTKYVFVSLGLMVVVGFYFYALYNTVIEKVDRIGPWYKRVPPYVYMTLAVAPVINVFTLIYFGYLVAKVIKE